jgi:predicted GIY-YIG superfamily endonuclease
MWPWNASTQGHLYIFHFNAPLGNLANRRAQASHYCGFADDLDSRIKKQLAGRGAKLVAAAMKQGLIFELYHWPACLATEKLVKKYKKTSAFCPACAAAAHRTPKALPTPPAVTQLAFDLDDAPLPEIAVSRLSWAEIQAQAAARRYFIKETTEADLVAIDDLL